MSRSIVDDPVVESTPDDSEVTLKTLGDMLYTVFVAVKDLESAVLAVLDKIDPLPSSANLDDGEDSIV